LKRKKMVLALFQYLSRSPLHRGAIILYIISLVFGLVAICTNAWLDVQWQTNSTPKVDVDVGVWITVTNGTEYSVTSDGWCDVPQHKAVLESSPCNKFIQLTLATAAVMLVAVVINGLNVCIAVYVRKMTLPIALLGMALYVAAVILFAAGAVPALKDSPREKASAYLTNSYGYSFALAVVATVVNVGAFLLVMGSCSAVRREALGFAGRDRQLADIASYKARMEQHFSSILSGMQGPRAPNSPAAAGPPEIVSSPILQGSDVELQQLVPSPTSNDSPPLLQSTVTAHHGEKSSDPTHEHP
jgi:uncharacterized membrane protein YidH (DUF202 family)